MFLILFCEILVMFYIARAFHKSNSDSVIIFGRHKNVSFILRLFPSSLDLSICETRPRSLDRSARWSLEKIYEIYQKFVGVKSFQKIYDLIGLTWWCIKWFKVNFHWLVFGAYGRTDVTNGRTAALLEVLANIPDICQERRERRECKVFGWV